MERLASVGNWSPALANLVRLCKLGGFAFFVLLPLLPLQAGSASTMALEKALDVRSCAASASVGRRHFRRLQLFSKAVNSWTLGPRQNRIES